MKMFRRMTYYVYMGIQGYVTPADDFFREILNDNEISDEFKKIIS